MSKWNTSLHSDLCGDIKYSLFVRRHVGIILDTEVINKDALNKPFKE